MANQLVTGRQREVQPSGSKSNQYTKIPTRQQIWAEYDKNVLQRTIIDPLAATPAHILGLQKAIGNQAVSGIIQTKLTVGPVNDYYEREADRVAEQVIDTSHHNHQGNTPSIKPMVQRAYSRSSSDINEGKAYETDSALESKIRVNQSGGQPLPESTRNFMESRFGADLSQVRVHTGSAAEQLSQELRAEAFTHGKDIYMAPGRYNPHAQAGQRLLAHEITHVIQQGGTTNSPTVTSAVQRWPWGKNKKEKEKQLTTPITDQPNATRDPAAYMKWLKTHPGLLSEKERQFLGVKKEQKYDFSTEQMDDFAQKRKAELAQELEALGTGKGKDAFKHSRDEAGDVSSMIEDPRFQARYKVDRKSDHGNWFARKFKRGIEVAGDKLKEAKSYLPGQHSVVPGEDYEKQFETKGQKAKRIAKTAAKLGAKKILGKIPFMSGGMEIASAVKEHKRQKKAENIGDKASANKSGDAMQTPFLQSMSRGIANQHFTNKITKGISGGISLVSDVVTTTGNVLSMGSSLGIAPAANAVFQGTVKPILNAGIKGAKVGVQLGKLAAGSLIDDRKYRKEASAAKSDQKKGNALGKLAEEDAEFSQAMLKHLAPDQMSMGKELYTNRMIQKPKADHTLKPSEVAKLAQQEKARLRERRRMGAESNWSLERERAEAKSQKQAQKMAKNKTQQNNSNIPTPPPLPPWPINTQQPPASKRENLLSKLLQSEEKKWYE
ncbi:MAG: DUF4157 domain-containing protein [Syntrophomonadaceae bacterium]|jgi:hypothetical protein